MFLLLVLFLFLRRIFCALIDSSLFLTIWAWASYFPRLVRSPVLTMPVGKERKIFTAAILFLPRYALWCTSVVLIAFPVQGKQNKL